MRFPCLLVIFYLSISFDYFGQKTLFGLTTNGGGQFGTIFGLPLDSSILSYSYNFKGFEGSTPTYGKLLLATNGKYYGTTSAGGNFNKGIIYEYQPGTNTYNKIFDFNDSLGTKPICSLIQGSNGKIYGLTNLGGLYSSGVLFEFNIAANIYTKLFDFGSLNGSNPSGALIEASNGKLYGTTQNGGVNGKGVLFEYNYTSNTFLKRFDFALNSGAYPIGALLENSSGILYGIASQGGPNSSTDQGVIFTFNLMTSSYSVQKSFIYPTGWNPTGELTKAPNGKLYGTASNGAVNNYGCIFEFDPSTNNYINKYNFTTASGYQSCRALLLASTGKMYGSNFIGATYGFGCIFEYDYINNIYNKLYSFQNTSDGENPTESLIEISGKLYSTTMYGGVNNSGIMFELNLLGNIFTKKFDFSSSEASEPNGSFIQASNGMLYGLSLKGGANNVGTVIEFNPALNSFTKKIDLSTINGSTPFGSLIKTSSGRYYGLTYGGGTNNFGVLFEYIPSSNTYTKIIDFNSSIGIYPLGTLCEASNGKLYGITKTGSPSSFGAIFEFDTLSKTCIKKTDITFSLLSGNPHVKMVEASNSKLYAIIGTTGSMYSGKLIEYDYSLNVVSDMHTFSTLLTGVNPDGYLALSSNGKLYGCAGGGSNSNGVIYAYDPILSNYQKIYDFNIGEGSSDGILFWASNNKFYGLSDYNGSYNCGTIFEFDPALLIYKKCYDFKCKDGFMSSGNSFIELNIAVTSQINKFNPSNKFQIYPNPTNGQFNLQFKKINQKTEIKIFNSLGQLVLEKNILSTDKIGLSISNQPSGIYFVEVNADGEVYREKVVKE